MLPVLFPVVPKVASIAIACCKGSIFTGNGQIM